MRSFIQRPSLKILALTASMLAVPLAGAYASASDAAPPDTFYGPRIDSIRNQLAGVEQGVGFAVRADKMTPAAGQHLHAQLADLGRDAERVAASHDGKLPAGQYHRIMRRFDRLDQKLAAAVAPAPNQGYHPYDFSSHG